jgi:hypothetical protein
MITKRRRIIRSGPISHAIIIPSGLVTGKEVTLAASRLMLVDVRGEIPEVILARLLEDVVEPALSTVGIMKGRKGDTKGEGKMMDCVK